MITRTLLIGLLAGLAAGVVLTLLYIGKIQPLMMAAEAYEQGLDATQSAPFMRFFDTFLFNILNGVGFGFLLAAILVMRGRPVGVGLGVLWGAAGFLVFVLAPSAGMPPELPGSIRAPLEERQIWWLLTVAATAGGLALLTLQARRIPMGVGILLILLPHILGAPRTDVYGGTLPAELASAFVGISIGTMALFWVVLGGVAGWCHDRFTGGRAEEARA